MRWNVLEYAVLFAAALPFIYYFLVLYSATHYFLQARRPSAKYPDFTPPISNLKPVRGLDPEAYENFASLCRQDYPEYELIFCVTDQTDPSVPVIQKLMKDFPERQIRLLYSAGSTALNDKVAKLRLMVSEARYEHLVFNDSDVRVDPGYLRRLIAPLGDPKVGGVTCFYVPAGEGAFVNQLQDIGMMSDFYAGILVAWELDGVHFALGPTMASTKQRVEAFGGFQVLENGPADDLLFGRLIAEQGVEFKLLPNVVKTVPDFQGFRELVAKRLRWMTVMRSMPAVGTLWAAIHVGIAVDHAGGAGTSNPGRGGGILGLVPDLPRRNHVADWDLRVEAVRRVGKNATDPAVGRSGVLGLADEFYAVVDPLERRGLPTPRRPLCFAVR